MTSPSEPLPQFLAEASRIGQEISVTGKWIPTPKSGLFSKSPASTEMLKVWEDIRAISQTDPGLLSIEINHAVGQDAVLVHQIFKDSDAVVSYFSTTVALLMASLLKVAGRTCTSYAAWTSPRRPEMPSPPSSQRQYSDSISSGT